MAIIVSLVALSYQAAHPRVYALGRKPGTEVFRALSAEHPEDETFPGLLMVRPEGRIFFANAQWVGDQIARSSRPPSPRVLALDLSAVSDIEYSALKMLIEGEERLRERGILLWLVALNPEALGMVQRSSLGETLGRERMFFNLETRRRAFPRSGQPLRKARKKTRLLRGRPKNRIRRHDRAADRGTAAARTARRRRLAARPARLKGRLAVIAGSVLLRSPNPRARVAGPARWSKATSRRAAHAHCAAPTTRCDARMDPVLVALDVHGNSRKRVSGSAQS